MWLSLGGETSRKKAVHIHRQVFLSRIDLKRVLWCVGLNYEDLLELGWETLHALQFSMDKLNLGKYCSS